MKSPIVNLYSNPNNGIFNLEIKNLSKENLLVEFINVRNQIIYSQKFENKAIHIIEQIDLSNQPKGIYFVKVQNSDIVKVGKLVIQ